MNEHSSLLRKYADAGNILIYQMGKVGSTSLQEGITNSSHFHTLYNNYPCQAMFRYYGRELQFKLLVKNAVKRSLILRRPEVRILCVVREPRARSISMLFQDINIWMSEYFRGHFEEARREGMELLFDVYCKACDHGYHNTWFDREIRRFTGIDVFAAPFDTRAGYALHQRGKFRLLLVRAEDTQRNLPVIEDFCGQEIVMQNLNNACNKWYGPVYGELRDRIMARRPFPEAYEQSRFSRHFGY